MRSRILIERIWDSLAGFKSLGPALLMKTSCVKRIVAITKVVIA
ncbi:MAG: hypothetical protein V1888_04250 [archaeon]